MPSTICTACTWHTGLPRSIEEKSWDKAVGDTQPDPGTKLNLDLPLCLEWEGLQQDQFMTDVAAVAEDNMLESAGFFFSPGWHP